jgi:uncharacterized protein (TIGR03000 family)
MPFTTRRLVAVAAAVVLFAAWSAGPASAQLRRPAPAPARPGGFGLPNPLSDPAFNWWYHHAPRYTDGSATFVVPPPWWNPAAGRYPYHPWYGPGYGGTTIINPTTVVAPAPAPAWPTTSPVTGQPVGPADILVKLPAADARVKLNGVDLSGTGAERHLAVTGVRAGASHQYVVEASWTADGKTTTSKRIVYLDGTGHGVADFTRPAPW